MLQGLDLLLEPWCAMPRNKQSKLGAGVMKLMLAGRNRISKTYTFNWRPGHDINCQTRQSSKTPEQRERNPLALQWVSTGDQWGIELNHWGDFTGRWSTPDQLRGNGWQRETKNNGKQFKSLSRFSPGHLRDQANRSADGTRVDP